MREENFAKKITSYFIWSKTSKAKHVRLGYRIYKFIKAKFDFLRWWQGGNPEMQKWSRLVCHSRFFCFLQLRHGRYKCHYGIPLRSRQIRCLESAFSRDTGTTSPRTWPWVPSERSQLSILLRVLEAWAFNGSIVKLATGSNLNLFFFPSRSA